MGIWCGESAVICSVAVLQSCFEDLRALTGGSRPPILRLHSDKASEFLTPTIRATCSQQGVRQTVNSGYDPQGNGLAERWIGVVKVRATRSSCRSTPSSRLLVLCRWVAYIHTHTESQKSQSIRRYRILGMWLLCTMPLRSHHLLRTEAPLACV